MLHHNLIYPSPGLRYVDKDVVKVEKTISKEAFIRSDGKYGFRKRANRSSIRIIFLIFTFSYALFLQFQLKTDLVSLTIIDDCGDTDVPLLDIRFNSKNRPFSKFQDLFESQTYALKVWIGPNRTWKSITVFGEKK